MEEVKIVISKDLGAGKDEEMEHRGFLGEWRGCMRV